jgi:hypothetical protein
MPRRGAGRAGSRAELRTRLLGVAGLDDLASLAERFFGQRAARAVGQRLRAMHFVEMGFVDLG